MNYHLITYNLVNNCLFFFIYEMRARRYNFLELSDYLREEYKKQQAERLHDEINCDGHALIKGLSTFLFKMTLDL
jgi:hypothetical protein